jgi:hypothetical protein
LGLFIAPEVAVAEVVLALAEVPSFVTDGSTVDDDDKDEVFDALGLGSR